MAAQPIAPTGQTAAQALLILVAFEPLKPVAQVATRALASVTLPLVPLDPLAIFSAPPPLAPPDFLSDLPPYEQSSYEVQAVQTAVSNELARIEAARQALTTNFFPLQADALLTRFEQLLGLPVNPIGVSLASRQQLAGVYMQRLKSEGSGLDWVALISQAVGTQNWSYQEHNPAVASPVRSAILATPGLVSYWRLGEASGSVLDSGTGGNPGTAVGGVTRNVAGLVGDTDGAVATDGATGKYIDVPFRANLDVGAQLTLEMWVKPTAIAAAVRVVAHGIVYYVEVDTATPIYNVQAQNTGLTVTNISSTVQHPAVGRVDHVVFVYDSVARLATLYINGAVESTSALIGTPIKASSTDLVLLAPSAVPGAVSFTGVLDEVAIYNVALTPLQVTQHLAAAAAAYAVSVSIPPTAAGSWPLIRDLTPAHLAINESYTGGFIVGSSTIGSNL